jgi:hypothetical protein
MTGDKLVKQAGIQNQPNPEVPCWNRTGTNFLDEGPFQDIVIDEPLQPSKVEDISTTSSQKHESASRPCMRG